MMCKVFYRDRPEVVCAQKWAEAYAHVGHDCGLFSCSYSPYFYFNMRKQLKVSCPGPLLNIPSRFRYLGKLEPVSQSGILNWV